MQSVSYRLRGSPAISTTAWPVPAPTPSSAIHGATPWPANVLTFYIDTQAQGRPLQTRLLPAPLDHIS
jgi:hypothetical protein